MREGDEWKTAFSTTTGHYQYRVMPYGLACAQSVFQCFINYVLREFLGRCVIAYIDDILIYSPLREVHVQHVHQVLDRLRQSQLFVKGGKCKLYTNTVTFLGYMINAEGIAMDEEKLATIRDWPTPCTVKELQWFLGFASLYRSFIHNFSLVASLLTSLLNSNAKHIVWPDPNIPFTVEVDASDTDVEAILFSESQKKASGGILLS